MNVRDKSIIVGLALLVGSYAVACQDFNCLSGVKSGQYSDLKNQYQRNPSPDLLNALQAKLNQIPSVIVAKPQPLKDRQVNWYNAEKAWVDSLVAATPTRAPAPAIPAAPAGAAPVLPIQGPITGAQPGTKLRAQADQANKLVADFNIAVANKDLNTMNAIYQQMLNIFPQLELIDEATREQTLEQAKKAIDREIKAVGMRPQTKQMNALTESFDEAAARKAIDTMNNIYQQMLNIFPQLNLINEQFKQEALANTKKTIDEMAINGLFDYIAQRKDSRSARRAESALIRILNQAPKNPAIRQQQDQLITLICKNGLYDTAYGRLISPSMMIDADKPRTEPITADDKAIKT